MQLKTKKIIAREFILLILCISISLIVLLATYLHTCYYQSKQERYSKRIISTIKTSDYLKNIYDNKEVNQNRFTTEMNYKYMEPKVSNIKFWTVLYRIAKHDSVDYKWKNKWEPSLIEAISNAGYKNPKDFQKFILSNIITKTDIDNQDSIKQMNVLLSSLYSQENIYKRKIHDFDDRKNTAYITFLIAIGIVFFVRYFYYAIAWSYKVLKQ